MAATDNGERRADMKTQLMDRLHDPLQLRVILIGLVLAVGYFGIFTPLSENIAKTTKAIERERKLEVLADNIEQLQKQCDSYKNRLTHQADGKEWMQYILDGVRGFPLKLTKLDCVSTKKIGPYEAVVLQIDVEGTLFDLDQFLRWLETNQRMFRLDEISIDLVEGRKTFRKAKSDEEVNKDDMVMRLTVTGMAG
jgi:type II secretory pathway component PulM